MPRIITSDDIALKILKLLEIPSTGITQLLIICEAGEAAKIEIHRVVTDFEANLVVQSFEDYTVIPNQTIEQTTELKGT